MMGRLGYLDPFLPRPSRLGESPAFCQRDDEVTAGEHRGQSRQAQALLAERAVEICYVCLEALDRASIVPQAAVDPTQIVLRHYREAPILQGGRHGHGALSSHEGAVRVTHLRKMRQEIDRDPS